MRCSNLVLVLSVVLATAACDDKTGTGAAPTTSSSTTSMATTGSASAMPSAAMSATAAASADPAAAAAMAADEDRAADELRTHHRHHHHGGVAMFIHMAIDSLGVSPDTKTKLDKIQSDLHDKLKPSREAGKVVLGIVADGVAAGNIDNAKLDAALAKQATAAAGVHAATQDAMNQLHDALSPAERQALVDKVNAHAAVWKKVNQDEDHGSKEKGSHLTKLTEQLSLTPDQADKISAALKKDAPPKPDAAAIDAHLKAFSTAFVADKFDAKTLTTANAANAQISKDGEGRMVRFYKIVTPLLTPEQRTKLADRIRERLNDQHGGGGAAAPAGSAK